MRSTKKPSVAFWTSLPAPYMVDRFNAVADLGELNFEAWFLGRIAPWRKWTLDESEWRFAYRYFPAKYWRDYWWGWPGFMLRPGVPDVIVQLWHDPMFVLGAAMARMRGRSVGLYVEGPPDGWRKRTSLKQFVKSQVIKRADFILCPGEDTRKFVGQFRGDDSRIFCAPHPFAFDHYHGISTRARKEERQALREEFKLKGITFVYVGGLWARKGVDYLLRAFDAVRKEKECSLLIIGDGYLQQQLRDSVKQAGTPDVIFAGFIQKDRLPAVLAAADVFVFPTLGDTNGYVVEEAMACELPVISTDAAGEIRVRIKEGVTGFVVPSRSSEALAEKMRMFARGEADAASMGEAATRSVAFKTPEWWAREFTKFIQTVSCDP